MSDEKQELTFHEAVEQFAGTLVYGTRHEDIWRAEVEAMRALVRALTSVDGAAIRALEDVLNKRKDDVT